MLSESDFKTTFAGFTVFGLLNLPMGALDLVSLFFFGTPDFELTDFFLKTPDLELPVFLLELS
jgi:hypothetical protein